MQNQSALAGSRETRDDANRIQGQAGRAQGDGGPLKGWLIILNAATDQLLLLPPQIADYIRIKDDSRDHEFTGAQYGGARYDMDVFADLVDDQLRATRGPKYDLNLGDVRAVLDGFAITKEQSEQFISDATWATTNEQALPLLKTAIYMTPGIGQLLAAAEAGWAIGRTIDQVRKGEKDLGTALWEGASEVVKAIIFRKLGKVVGEVIDARAATGGPVPFQPPLRKRLPRPAPTEIAVRPVRRDYGGAKGPPASQPLDDAARRRAMAGFRQQRKPGPEPKPESVQPQDGPGQPAGGGRDAGGKGQGKSAGGRAAARTVEVNVTPARAEQALVDGGLEPARARAFVASGEGSLSVKPLEPRQRFVRYAGEGGEAGKGYFVTERGGYSSAEAAQKALDLRNPPKVVQVIEITRPVDGIASGIKGGSPGATQVILPSKDCYRIVQEAPIR